MTPWLFRVDTKGVYQSPSATSEKGVVQPCGMSGVTAARAGCISSPMESAPPNARRRNCCFMVCSSLILLEKKWPI